MLRRRSTLRRTLLTAVALSLGLSTVPVAGPATAGAPPSAARRGGEVVRTTDGAVRGQVSPTGRAFRQIPFAAPPVGALRWRAPQPPKPWKGVRDATTPAPVTCAQDAYVPTAQQRVVTEDCLYLNVHTPPGPQRSRPVMVYLHGGAFTNGNGHQFDGAALARQGVVVVTINYRLGAFGYLAHPALSAEDQQAKSGNYGLLDQQAALRWVRANAAAFGGDSRRVTVFGQSAGGESVCALLTSPQAAGLFSRAIVQSGPCHLVATPLPRAEAIGTSFATAAGCTDEAVAAACLRALSPAATLDAVRVTPDLAGSSQVFAPTTQTPVLPTSPSAAIAAGTQHRVPVMIGTTLDEGTVLTMILTAGIPVTADSYRMMMTGWFGDDVARVEAEYPLVEHGGNYGATVSAILGDWLVICQDSALRRSLAATTPTYAYEFADRTAPNIYAVAPDFPLGAYHAGELPYLAPAPSTPLNAGQERLSEQMLRYWARFAAGGTPNGPGTPKWAPFTADRPVVQQLDLGSTVGREDFDARHKCGLWAELTS